MHACSYYVAQSNFSQHSTETHNIKPHRVKYLDVEQQNSSVSKSTDKVLLLIKQEYKTSFHMWFKHKATELKFTEVMSRLESTTNYI